MCYQDFQSHDLAQLENQDLPTYEKYLQMEKSRRGPVVDRSMTRYYGQAVDIIRALISERREEQKILTERFDGEKRKRTEHLKTLIQTVAVVAAITPQPVFGIWDSGRAEETLDRQRRELIPA